MQGNMLRCYTHRYAQVSMTICFEKELSGKALGYYTKMQSLDEGFHFSIEGFSKLFKDGRDSVRGGIKELEEFGYLVRAQRRVKRGRYSDDTLWITLDEPGLQKELWDYLEERNYVVLSKPKREAARPELHLDLASLGVRIEAIELEAAAESEDYYERNFGADLQKQRLAEFAERGYVPLSVKSEVFHNEENPSSEPMTDFPSPVVTCEDEMDELDALEAEMWKTELAVENDVESEENPSSEPMTDFPSPVVTCEDSENLESLPSSGPMTGFPSAENPMQSLSSVGSISFPLATKPHTPTSTTCQVEPIGGAPAQPDAADPHSPVLGQAPTDGVEQSRIHATSTITALEELSAQSLPSQARGDCIEALTMLIAKGVDPVVITMDFSNALTAEPGLRIDEWLGCRPQGQADLSDAQSALNAA